MKIDFYDIAEKFLIVLMLFIVVFMAMHVGRKYLSRLDKVTNISQRSVPVNITGSQKVTAESNARDFISYSKLAPEMKNEETFFMINLMDPTDLQGQRKLSCITIKGLHDAVKPGEQRTLNLTLFLNKSGQTVYCYAF